MYECTELKRTSMAVNGHSVAVFAQGLDSLSQLISIDSHLPLSWMQVFTEFIAVHSGMWDSCRAAYCQKHALFKRPQKRLESALQVCGPIVLERVTFQGPCQYLRVLFIQAAVNMFN